ncbi:hypothetical protein K439DRAFT_1623530 [Ramaria rubella]|nr:hypothetical protein K439DRAFT_1623530 [Ramaria rubella]
MSPLYHQAQLPTYSHPGKLRGALKEYKCRCQLYSGLVRNVQITHTDLSTLTTIVFLVIAMSVFTVKTLWGALEANIGNDGSISRIATHVYEQPVQSLPIVQALFTLNDSLFLPSLDSSALDPPLPIHATCRAVQ